MGRVPPSYAALACTTIVYCYRNKTRQVRMVESLMKKSLNLIAPCVGHGFVQFLSYLLTCGYLWAAPPTAQSTPVVPSAPTPSLPRSSCSMFAFQEAEGDYKRSRTSDGRATNSSSYWLHVQERIATLGAEGNQFLDPWFIGNSFQMFVKS